MYSHAATPGGPVVAYGKQGAFLKVTEHVQSIVGKVFTRVVESYKNRPIAFPQKALTSDSTTSV